ncbi:MAG: 30S ribosomal protein S4e [Nitrososphaerota archaeon]|uniref:30S ribosomal protein S4e n=1 Tax=Candidatus Bathycorpusculum sp. TaxID=2994959 RepID=UPI002832DB16|nr:30S ribosomal protein S4e [Candidatus Termiticorpusculum sp.]MCL2257575.1 30S ribosomal protein S4e [Candidatus Termiticorpusculum sp.]MCL2292290.1 30S ribosomal protein S4e [Candidatus Termiticorpusculum sp.]MDR0461264.1 30S ribosomal protein S4e [Nitrososphaerota archaeon]
MGRKGKTARLKRKPAPKYWPIHRKESLWVIKPAAGPHSLQRCLPLTLVLRDVLGVAGTRREGKLILSEGKVQVNGIVRKKDDFPVGLMDVISMPTANQYYRVVPSHKGLILSAISKEEAKYRLVRVEDKSTTKVGVQVALHDGTNMLIRIADPKNPVEVTYETFDILKINIADGQVVGKLKTKENNTAVITGGKNIGVQGKIVEIEKTEAKKRRQALVVIENDKGVRCQTILDFIFSIDNNEPEPVIVTEEPEENTVV